MQTSSQFFLTLAQDVAIGPMGEPTATLSEELNSAGNDPRKRAVGSARPRGQETAPQPLLAAISLLRDPWRPERPGR